MKLTLLNMEDILKVKLNVGFLHLILWRNWHEKMEYDHEEDGSFTFIRSADISDDAGAVAGTGAERIGRD